MRKILLLLVTAVTVLFGGACCLISHRKPTADQFTVNNVYGNHMVLQRQKPLQIVGKAEAGKSVKVEIGKNSTFAVADSNGIWKAVLPAMEAGGPYTLSVCGADESKAVVFNDVLIGEVWLCSGQSNMEMPVVGGRFWCSKNGRAEAAAANFPNIRIFYHINTTSPGTERTQAKSAKGWEVCTPETIGKFSACGFYFARQLHKDLNIPIGIIDAAWSGTRIQPWISKAGYELGKREDELNLIRIAEEEKQELHLKKSRRKSNAAIMKWLNRFYSIHAAESAAAAQWMNVDTDTSGWKSVRTPYTVDSLGVVWFRREVELPAEWAGRDLKLSLGTIDDLDETYFNGTKVGEVDILTSEYWQKKRNYSIPGKLVKAGKNVIAVRVSNINRTGDFGTGKSLLFLANGKEKKMLNGNWLMRKEFFTTFSQVGELPAILNFHLNSNQYPATLYNGMIHPWTAYPMRGWIWYQGCSNTRSSREYMILHPLLIQDWRNRWNDQNMPFIFAQLSAYEKHNPWKPIALQTLKSLPPRESAFAELRETQTATLNIPLTGMAVTIDIGDHSDIHPANKQDVGYRMAQEAKRLVYGCKDITSGPMFKSMQLENGRIRINFTNTGKGLLVKGDKLNCFAIAGKDGKFVWANAKIDGNSVIVWSDEVKEPANVRYAWAGFPVEPNLYNKEGFPACPFRTDMPDYLLK